MYNQYPKRLIEVDLPIKRISEHARREKSIRHGHISTLHIWWARRPLAACRAVLCAALWPDPADPMCPTAFREIAKREMMSWARVHRKLLSEVSLKLFLLIDKDHSLLDSVHNLRRALLHFIADFSSWNNACKKDYLRTCRLLTQVAHESLGGIPGTRPIIVDPFAGGGAIPLESIRVGGDAFASDLNPVAVLLNKVVLEYLPKYGGILAEEVRKWGDWIKVRAEEELAEYYPTDSDGSKPIAYMWARTVTCEGPGCGAEIPLLRSLWLAKKGKRSIAVSLTPDMNTKRVAFSIIENARVGDVSEGTVRRGSATCPICGFTTPVASVRKQMKFRRGGANAARLFCVVTKRPNVMGRYYRLPTEQDIVAARKAAAELNKLRGNSHAGASIIPDEPTPSGGGSGAGRAFSQRNYGMDTFEDLFTHRQLLALSTLVRLLHQVENLLENSVPAELKIAILTMMSLAIDRQADFTSSLCSWWSGGEKIQHTFARHALPIIWDFVECNPWSGSTGAWEGAYQWGVEFCEHIAQCKSDGGHVQRASAQSHPLPDDSCQAVVTDPPYYDAVPYADLSDFFYVWLKRTVGHLHKDLFQTGLSPKDDECIVDEVKKKDQKYFEYTMTQAMKEAKRVLAPDGIGVVVFAHKSTSGWEAQLQAMIEAGWTVTGSWPIDTEMSTRLRAMNSAALASSIHLVVRPRQASDQIRQLPNVGDWRDVLNELPQRIHDWLPRLSREGIVGADAIFSCLGPALEVFSRYSKVEKASGEQVFLREYLEYVWAAVSREALNMIFEGADASGFEEDARLTAMWLWTLSTGSNGNGTKSTESVEEELDEDEAQEKQAAKISGFVLEYDAARKIAQGLGAHLDRLTTLAEVKGSTARLLPVSDRANYLFDKKADQKKTERPKPKSGKQLSFADVLGKPQQGTSLYFEGGKINFSSAKTTLDRIHQSMLLFAMGESGYLKRLLVEEGAGVDPKFWQLAQALSALYPSHTAEKRWIDGVMARKKTLGL